MLDKNLSANENLKAISRLQIDQIWSKNFITV